ncbi:hypothetical protein DEU56DRAFT_781629 [Suillus clintonianus]|uniref:uncharacterized protein n=1 Tax=Suillus clintonianus TaxID=1904413 RepID=UPI001B85B917|nr:uncharacterized protein DEU56DRAFT_781629 [Suillus clintonianus]KAG2149324.1 hypothetical protein DEU56DRAFT_781629 [Suillus clintonianus]
MASKIFLRGVLPVAIFIPMSFIALQIVFGRHMYQSGTGLQLLDHCNVPIGTEGYPLRLAYTGYPDLDDRMCALVALFHALLDPAYRPLVAELMTALAAVTMIPFVEAAREERSIFLRMPAAVGVLFQLFSFAVIMPIYYVALILSGAAIGSPVKGRATKIAQGSAEALLFALIVGYIIPTVCMVLFRGITSTALWQGYPIIMAFAQFVYLIIRPSSRRMQSGYATIQAMYGLIFVTSAIFHIYYTWPLFFDIQQFQKVLVPHLALSKHPLSLPEGVAAVIQWDAVFGIGSTLFVTFWFAQGVKEIVLLFLWHALVSVAFGPGAAIAGVMLFREARLNGQTPVEDKEE